MANYALSSFRHNGKSWSTPWTEDLQPMDVTTLNCTHKAQAAERI